jgi:peptidylprolyl isomerase
MTSPMKRAGIILGILLAAVGVFFAATIAAPSARAQEGTPHWLIELKDGTVDIELLPGVAPLHVARIVELTNAGFYNGIVWHRVIPGFMAQSGDPTGTGAGGSDLPDVVAEFNDESFTRGAVGAARTNDPNTFNSQFFICFDDCTFLDRNYTVFGRVVSGMEAVDAIKKGDPQSGAMPDPDKIVSATIEYRQ